MPYMGHDNAADRAATWLRNYLTKHGRSPSSTVKAAAAKAGHSEQSINRARRSIGVRIRSEGFERGKRTLWSLTTDGSEVTISTVPTDRTEPTDPPEFDVEVEDIGQTHPLDPLATVNRELHAAKLTDQASTPPCPSCSLAHSVGRRNVAPPGELHCWHCGHNWTP